MTTTEYTIEQMWDWLIDTGAASEDTLKVVTSINGYNTETLENVLYATTGYRSFEQIDEEQ